MTRDPAARARRSDADGHRLYLRRPQGSGGGLCQEPRLGDVRRQDLAHGVPADRHGFRYADTATNGWARDDLASLREFGGTARPLAFNCRPTAPDVTVTTRHFNQSLMP